MPAATEHDRLIAEWRALHLRYAEAALLAREGDVPEATDPSLAGAEESLGRCFIEIINVFREEVHGDQGEDVCVTHAAQIREARRCLAQARHAIDAAHRMASHARGARERARRMWQEERLRWERIQRRPKL